MHSISHYEVTNRITGVTKRYKTGVRASRACDAADNAYGAVICSRRAIWTQDVPDDAAADAQVAGLEELGFTCTPASLAAEHAAEVSFLDAQGFARAGQQVAP